jgi:hypothetical protein
MKLTALVAGSALLGVGSALEWTGPQATQVSKLADYQGFSPKPTDVPGPLELAKQKRDYVPDNYCGYISGSSGGSRQTLQSQCTRALSLTTTFHRFRRFLLHRTNMLLLQLPVLDVPRWHARMLHRRRRHQLWMGAGLCPLVESHGFGQL